MDGEKVTGNDSSNFSINAQLDSTPRNNIFGRKTRGEPNKDIVEDTNIRYLDFYKGEDICSKLYWYATNTQKNICVMSATGSISEVTLQTGDNYLVTNKYEGFYKIVTLAGLILPIKTNTTGSTIAVKQGGLMVAFEGEDGRLVNGLVSSSLIAYEKVEVLASIYTSRPSEYKTWEEIESSESIQISSSVSSGSIPNFQSNLQWVTSTTNPVSERAEVTSNNRFVGQGSSMPLKPKETPKDNQNRKVLTLMFKGITVISRVTLHLM
ncbi:AT-hook motif nuclear-localized protein 8-like, partial [Impatiens glandulifera]|uniref:AT-hook motif nuclear-localized protein 8-like n=1 Tax=Impatiens glandulifera TaxID=253017 RepID=UPI001FB177F1